MSPNRNSPQWSMAASADQIGLSEAPRPIAGWVTAVVLIGALLSTMGAVISLVNPAMLVSPHDTINGAVHIYAGYVASRDAAIAILLVSLLMFGLRRALGNLMVLVALVQFLDVVIDCFEMRWAVAGGVFVFGLVFLAGAARLSGFPFWKRGAWL